MAVVMGVDGAAGRWAVAVWSGPGTAPEVLVRERPADVRRLAADRGARVVGVDVPLGLRAVGVRTADAAARRRLAELARAGPPEDVRGATSRLFMTPDATVTGSRRPYADVCALARSRGAPAPSRQTFGILQHVRDWGEDRPRWSVPGHASLVEVHPELSFAEMGGRLLARKRSARGTAQRLRALGGRTGLGCGEDAVLRSLEASAATLGHDDALDAMAAAWTAARVADPGGGPGGPLLLPDPPEPSVDGLGSAIHV